MPNNKGKDPLKFRILVIQGLEKKHGSAVPQPAYGRPSTKLPPKRVTEHHFLEQILDTRNMTKPHRRYVMC
jgi:hypothetical protein